MKPGELMLPTACRLVWLLPAAAVAGLLVPLSGVRAQGKEVVEPLSMQETHMDLPADFHKYYGQNVNQWRDEERKVAKLDMDTDMDYDGDIENEDPADQGAFEATPPGLVLGVGEMAKFLIRVRPYRLDYRGEVVLTLEVQGINRADRTGEFASFAEEQVSTGRVRVWSDSSRSKLLLDSADPNRRYHEWVIDAQHYPANLPGIYPRLVFVEGVKPSPRFLGDIRLLITISQRERGSTRQTFQDYRKAGVKSFRTSFDHILVTVQNESHPKVFVNNNAEGVWLKLESEQK